MITVQVHDQEVRAALKQLAARIGNLRPYLQAVGEDIMERAKLRFETSTGPDGRRWSPNARATVEAYLASKGGYGKKGINKKGLALAMSKKPLVGETRSLARQFHVAVTANGVAVGNTMIYAAIQQFGGQAGRGKKVTIPARPFLPIYPSGNLYPAEQAEILAQLNDYLAGR